MKKMLDYFYKAYIVYKILTNKHLYLHIQEEVIHN